MDGDNGAHAPAGAGAVFSVAQRWWLLFGVAALMLVRLPHAWWQGRFLGEEGTVFFAYGWHRPAAEALWRSFGGYLNLAANAATLAVARAVQGGLLSLAAAPRLTMTVAIAVQLVPPVLILCGRGAWLAHRRVVVTSLLLIAGCPMAEEVFANTLHIQFHLTLAAALLLALEPPRTWAGRWGAAAIFLLAPLCGPGAILLVPLFAARALLDRDPRRGAQSALLAAAGAVQLLLFFQGSPLRGHVLDPLTLVTAMAVRLTTLPFLSEAPANVIGRWCTKAYLAGGLAWVVAALVAAVALGAVVRLIWRDGRAAPRWLLAAALLTAAASFGGGMIASAEYEWFSTGAGERYNFAPLVLLSVALVATATGPADRRIRRPAGALSGLTLLSAAITFAQPVPELANGPDWAREVAAWRRDHRHPLASWPADWRLDLSDGDRPCPPRPRTAAVAADPTYCESAWMAHVMALTTADRAGQARDFGRR